jgi:hypothetical protein
MNQVLNRRRGELQEIEIDDRLLEKEGFIREITKTFIIPIRGI